MSEQETVQEEQQVSEETVTVSLPGQRLQEARESMNMSLQQAAQELRLDVRLLKALEEDNYSSLPGETYTYGYLRSYARLLKLPIDEVLNQYRQATSAAETDLIPDHLTFSAENKLPSFSLRQLIIWIVLLVAVLVAIGWVLLSDEVTEVSVSTVPMQETPVIEAQTETPVVAIEQTESSDKTEEEKTKAKVEAEPVTVTTKEVVIPPASITKAKVVPAKPAILNLTYQADSWTEIKDVNGKTLVFRMVKQGETLELDGEPPFTVLLGYAPGVTVKFAGKEFDTRRYQRDDIAYFLLGHEKKITATE